MNTRPIDVTLSDAEIWEAIVTGSLRRIAAIRSNAKPAYKCPDNLAWYADIEGAGGEIAFAKSRGIYFPARVNTFRRLHDVGNCEVRTCAAADARLVIHPEDHDNAPYVLVRGRIPNFTIVGWAYGRDAKRDEWWEMPKGFRNYVYLVPNDRLQPLCDLEAA